MLLLLCILYLVLTSIVYITIMFISALTVAFTILNNSGRRRLCQQL